MALTKVTITHGHCLAEKTQMVKTRIDNPLHNVKQHLPYRHMKCGVYEQLLYTLLFNQWIKTTIPLEECLLIKTLLHTKDHNKRILSAEFNTVISHHIEHR